MKKGGMVTLSFAFLRGQARGAQRPQPAHRASIKIKARGAEIPRGKALKMR